MSHIEESLCVDALVERVARVMLDGEPTLVEYEDRVNLQKNRLKGDLAKRTLNVYAIWVRMPDDVWRLHYVGQRSVETHAREGRMRLRQHLFHGYEGTGSHRAKVREAIDAGADIGVTTAHITPDALRTCVEQSLIRIARERCPGQLWNTHGNERQKPASPRVKRTSRQPRAADAPA